MTTADNCPLCGSRLQLYDDGIWRHDKTDCELSEYPVKDVNKWNYRLPYANLYQSFLSEISEREHILNACNIANRLKMALAEELVLQTKSLVCPFTAHGYKTQNCGVCVLSGLGSHQQTICFCWIEYVCDKQGVIDL